MPCMTPSGAALACAASSLCRAPARQVRRVANLCRADWRRLPPAAESSAGDDSRRRARRRKRTGATPLRQRMRSPAATSGISPTRKRRPRFTRSPSGWRGGCAPASFAAGARGAAATGSMSAAPSIAISRRGNADRSRWRRRKYRPLRLVLLLDASGSMELYTAFFVRFLHAVVGAFREAEAFVFHTRLVAGVERAARSKRRARDRPAGADVAGDRRRHPDRRKPCRFQRWHVGPRHSFAHRGRHCFRRLRYRRGGATRGLR